MILRNKYTIFNNADVSKNAAWEYEEDMGIAYQDIKDIEKKEEEKLKKELKEENKIKHQYERRSKK